MRSLWLLLLITIFAFAGKLEMVDDSELSDISAQGFTLNYQVMDNAIKNSLSYGAYKSSDAIRVNSSLFKYTGIPSSLVDSIMISGFAQKDAFVPINAVNSAVNVPINIVFVMNSKITGGINITNQLQSALKQPF